MSVKTKIAYLYVRVSTTKQVRTAHDPEGLSLPAQREACTRHAESLGAQVASAYVEAGKSGTSMNRPELQRMLADVRKHRPAYLVVYDLSRIARNERDTFVLIAELEAYGCKLESATERIDDTPSGKLVTGVMASVHAFRSRGDAEKIRLGLERKHLAGGSAGPARIGYLNDRETVEGYSIASISLDPERAPMIRELFELAATARFTVSSLTEIMQDLGLTSRAMGKRPTRPISKSSIHRILRDDYYLGIVTRKGVKRPGRHEPLVDQATFDKVQTILAANRVGGERSHKHTHYLNGSVFSGNCSVRLGYGRHRGRSGDHYEYSCLSHAFARPGPCGGLPTPPSSSLRSGSLAFATCRCSTTTRSS